MNKKNIILILSIILLISIITFLIINNNQPKGSLTEITYKDIKEKIKNKEDFILIVSRSTCSHCATYKPKIKTITKKNNLNIYYIDYDYESKTNQDKLLDELDLDGSTPITMFFKNGKETSLMDRLNGDLSETKVIDKLKKMGFIKK